MEEGEKAEWRNLAAASLVTEGCGFPVKYGGFRIVLIRYEDEVFALDELCPHADASIAMGPVGNGCIACPWHYAEFDLRTGEVLSGPATTSLRSYSTREIEGRIEVFL